MPISASAPSGIEVKIAWNSAPRPAPTESEGAKMPPGMPLTEENTVARNFSGMNSSVRSDLPWRMSLASA